MAVLGGLGGLLETSWGALGWSGEVLGSLGEVLGWSWGVLGRSWGGSRGSWGHLGRILGASWGVSGHLGAILGPLGVIWEPLGTLLGGVLGPPGGDLRRQNSNIDVDADFGRFLHENTHTRLQIWAEKPRAVRCGPVWSGGMRAPRPNGIMAIMAIWLSSNTPVRPQGDAPYLIAPRSPRRRFPTPKTPQDPPKTPQDHPKTTPRPPKTPSRPPKDPIRSP